MKFKTVEEYFDNLEEPAFSALTRLKKKISAILPGAEEYIGYQIPTLRYKGKPLVGYAAFKNHYSLFIMNMRTAGRLKSEYKEIKINGVTIQFKFNESISQRMLGKIIKARMKDTDEYLELKSKTS